MTPDHETREAERTPTTARSCARCGKTPPDGFASVWWGGREVFYCHPDEGEDCYSLTSWEVGR